MVTARRIGKIDVWPDYTTARAADTEGSKYIARLVVWPTDELAQEHIEYSLGVWLLAGGLWNDGGVWDDSASWED